MLENTVLNFVDIETTGATNSFNRITEVAALKVVNGKVIDRYVTLINPEMNIPIYISQFTGITQDMVNSAPTFSDIADDLAAFLEDGIFVAHNARFDYSFLKQEFLRQSIPFTTRSCCTVKLSRALFPHNKRHNLDIIMERFDIKIKDRHRAEGDAEATVEFFTKAREQVGDEKFISTFNQVVKMHSLPIKLMKYNFRKLPEAPGVYLFYDETGYPIYIGMSKNIRKRVFSHFYSDIYNSKEMNIKQKISDIKFIECGGVLSAKIKEALLVKTFKPIYNQKLRHDRSLVLATTSVDADGYINIECKKSDTSKSPEFENVAAVFRNMISAKEVLSGFVRESGLCAKLLHLEKTESVCFNYQLGHCKGACAKKISPEEYNAILDSCLEKYRHKNWPYSGPIMIEEVNAGDTIDRLKFDQWCYLGHADNEIMPWDSILKSQQIQLPFDGFKLDYSFDIDIYKLLQEFFALPDAYEHITLLE